MAVTELMVLAYTNNNANNNQVTQKTNSTNLFDVERIVAACQQKTKQLTINELAENNKEHASKGKENGNAEVSLVETKAIIAKLQKLSGFVCNVFLNDKDKIISSEARAGGDIVIPIILLIKSEIEKVYELAHEWGHFANGDVTHPASLALQSKPHTIASEWGADEYSGAVLAALKYKLDDILPEILKLPDGDEVHGPARNRAAAVAKGYYHFSKMSKAERKAYFTGCCKLGSVGASAAVVNNKLRS